MVKGRLNTGKKKVDPYSSTARPLWVRGVFSRRNQGKILAAYNVSS